MVFGIIKRIDQYIGRRFQRAYLANPETMPQRYAAILASIFLLSIIITYNLQFERTKRKEGIQPIQVTDIYREFQAKRKLEHVELQRNIIEARNSVTSKTSSDL